jgi:serine/threonine protein kinase
MTLTSGTRLGPYEVLSRLGAGGMGEVWKARDLRLNRFVALKQIIGNDAGRIEREARAIAALNHPHICQIHDVGPDYLVLEFIDGRRLEGPLPPQDAARLALQIADALDASHGCGILHCDLAVSNTWMCGAAGERALAGTARVDESAAVTDRCTIHNSEFQNPRSQIGNICEL